MSALPIGGEGGDTPRRGVPAENEAVRGGGASGVREETEPESAEFFGSWRCVFGVFEVVLKRVFKEKWTSSWASGSGCEGRERERLVGSCSRRRAEPGGEAGSSSSSLGFFASEDTYEGEDVLTGHGRRQRTNKGSSFSFSFWVYLGNVCV